MTTSQAAGEALDRLRAKAPLVHNITNYVAMDVTANALLALGGSPVMAHAVEEIEELAAIADALVINIGTLSREWVRAMHLAADRARALGTPWVLDPVGVGATAYRTAVARELAAHGPAVVRGNASEILALAGGADRTKGVDSTRPADQAHGAARTLARELGAVIAVTGAVDFVTDGARERRVANGHPLMTKVTALGCAATAVIGAFLGTTEDPLAAATHGLATFGLAGEIAARDAAGPGSFRWRLMDALAALDAEALARGARIE